MLWWVMSQADNYVETVLFQASSFMLNDQSTESKASTTDVYMM